MISQKELGIPQLQLVDCIEQDGRFHEQKGVQSVTHTELNLLTFNKCHLFNKFGTTESATEFVALSLSLAQSRTPLVSGSCEDLTPPMLAFQLFRIAFQRPLIGSFADDRRLILPSTHFSALRPINSRTN